MCFMSDMSTMGSALDNAVIPRYDAGMNPMDKRESFMRRRQIFAAAFAGALAYPDFKRLLQQLKCRNSLHPRVCLTHPSGASQHQLPSSNIHHRPAAIVSSIELALLRESTLNS